MPECQPAFERVLIKVSGEVLMGTKSFGIDPDVANTMAQEIHGVHALGVQPFAACHFEQRKQHVATDLGSARLAGNTEAVAAASEAGIAVDTELVGVEFQNLVRRRASVKTA